MGWQLAYARHAPQDAGLYPVASRALGHPRVRLHAEHRAASRLELSSLDAGAGPDVQNAQAGSDGDDALHQSVGIGRFDAPISGEPHGIR